jgi:hypothetical protein
VKKLILALFAVAALGACAAVDYGKALDQCAFDHIGDPAGRRQCQCDVSLDAGRSCDWLGDAGAAQ